ncbi:hypothetical protein B7R22_09805 [Subtercola boreus]|uniref:DUF4333 domain-containing protein n=1 Tax=Subtercola boreus TaxID=120213 RepID=A0A3E0VXA3_9MICO|nr:hypothetical protein [Subtercola boreus]RFA14506.1 hypothetical protein B7R22_09805 [Subtercola boreus]
MSKTSDLRPWLALSFAAIVLPFTLAGCSSDSGTLMMPAEEFAGHVADVMVDQEKIPRPIVTCGDSPVEIVDGATVHCFFSATEAPTVLYDSVTTISEVKGADFHIVTKVDAEPQG